MQCQYMHPITGERCDKETSYTIAVGPVRLPVCEGQHAKRMAPGGRNRAQMQHAQEEYEREQREKAMRMADVHLSNDHPYSDMARRMARGGLIWPKAGA